MGAESVGGETTTATLGGQKKITLLYETNFSSERLPSIPECLSARRVQRVQGTRQVVGKR